MTINFDYKIHRTMREKDQEIILFSSAHRLYSGHRRAENSSKIGVFRRGAISKVKKQKAVIFTIKNLMPIVTLLIISLFALSIAFNETSAIIMLGFLIVLCFMGLICDIVCRVKDKMTLVEEFYQENSKHFNEDKYLPKSSVVLSSSSMKVSDDEFVDYAKSLSADDFASLAQMADKWREIREAHNTLYREVNRNKSVNEEFKKSAEIQLSKLTEKKKQNEQEQNRLGQSIRDGNSNKTFLDALTKAETALAG